jgi:hypothetical protein
MGPLEGRWVRSGRPAGKWPERQHPPLQSGNRRSGAPCLWRSPDPYASFGFPRRVIRHDDVPPNLAWLVEERTWLQDELQEARAEADQAKADQVRMARDVATMFDELNAMADRYAELHADRARLQTDVDRLAGELEQARRPWWHRWLKRQSDFRHVTLFDGLAPANGLGVHPGSL